MEKGQSNGLDKIKILKKLERYTKTDCISFFIFEETIIECIYIHIKFKKERRKIE